MNKYENLTISILIVGLAAIFIPFLFIVFFSFWKFKIVKNIGVYIYALTSSMLVILGSFGFLREAAEIITHEYSTKNPHDLTLVTIGIMVSGLILGIGISVLTRYLIIKKTGNIHHSHAEHSHNDHIFNLRDIDNQKNKWSAIILVLNHRVIESLSLGILLVGHFDPTNSSYQFPIENLGFIIVFIAHMIPEAVFIYYRQREMGLTKIKSLLNAFYTKIIILPFIFVGGFALQAIPPSEATDWIMPFLFTVTGSILIFVSIIELVPEFIDNKNMSSKTWYITILFFTIGMIFALALTLLHTHGDGHHH